MNYDYINYEENYNIEDKFNLLSILSNNLAKIGDIGNIGLLKIQQDKINEFIQYLKQNNLYSNHDNYNIELVLIHVITWELVNTDLDICLNGLIGALMYEIENILINDTCNPNYDYRFLSYVLLRLWELNPDYKPYELIKEDLKIKIKTGV